MNVRVLLRSALKNNACKEVGIIEGEVEWLFYSSQGSEDSEGHLYQGFEVSRGRTL